MTIVDTSLLDQMIAWRKHLHQHPELSEHEAETSKFVCERLDELGIPYVWGVGGYGVVATLERGSSNRSVGLRADMDALPIHEENTFAHASTVSGVMHACGHDGHTAALLGAAAVLARDDDWAGTIRFVFQPAEENGMGAKAMIADGLFERFPFERIFAFHNMPEMDLGLVGVFDRPSMAAGGDWHVTLKGTACHAARPNEGSDVITAAGHLIVALNSIVSRNVALFDSVVLSCSMINGGTVSNQLPESVKLTGTLRTFNVQVREKVIARMREVINGVAATFALNADAVINSTGRVMADTPAESALSVAAAQEAGFAVTRNLMPSGGGDDFAFMVSETAGSYVYIGNGPVVDGGRLHHARYEFNDAVLPVAVNWLTRVAKRALAE